MDRDIGFEIKKISNLMKRNMENTLVCDKITPNHTYILGFLDHEKGRDIFQKDIEKEFSIRRSTATGILNLMEKKGLIKRIPCKEDARQKKIIMTKEGQEIQKESFKCIKKYEDKLKRCLTREELCVFFSVLDKLKKEIEED